MTTLDILWIVGSLFVGIYWLYAATIGWDRYMAARPRWITKKWQAFVFSGLGFVVAINFIAQAMGYNLVGMLGLGGAG